MAPKISIIEVAKAAGVSTATVSQALRGVGRMTETTRDRVLATADQLGYRPNALAQRFVNQRADTIGFLLDGIPGEAFHNPFWFEIINGAHAVCARHDMSLVLLHPDMISHKGGFDVLFSEKRIDGILFPDSPDNAEWRRRAMASQCPFVALGKPTHPSHHHWIDIDNHAAGAFMLETLAQRGLQRPLFLAGMPGNDMCSNRWQGFSEAARFRGLIPRDSGLSAPIYTTDLSVACARARLHGLIAGGVRFDCVAAAHNSMGLGALQALQEAGIRVPEDVSLITFDSFPLAAHSNPPITAIDMDMNGLGARAAELLLKIVHAGPALRKPHPSRQASAEPPLVQELLNLFSLREGGSLRSRSSED